MYDAQNEHDDYGESVDDMLEATRFNPLNASVGDNPLPEDNDRPASPADRTARNEHAEVDQQATDTNMQDSEMYEKGPHGGQYYADEAERSGAKNDSIMINRWEDI